MKSIRRRLHRNLFQALVLLVALFGAMFYLAFREALVEEFDANQQILAEALAERFERLPDGDIEFDPTPEMIGRFADRPAAEYFQVWKLQDGTLFRSPSLGEGELRSAAESLAQGQTWDLELPDGRSGRAVVLEFEPQMDNEDGRPEVPPDTPAQRLALVYARSREFLDRVLWLAALSFATLAILLPLCGAFFLGRAVRKGLSPLDRLSEEIRSIKPGTPGRRFTENGLPEELRPIAGRLNELLDRTENAFEREKRFSSNVAHELRTPIAELKTVAEVGLGADVAADDSALELRQCLKDTLEIALQMERIVTALLALRNAQRGETGLEIEPLDFAAMIKRSWDVWKTKADARGLECKLTLPAAARIDSDEALLGAVLSNILENAVSHTPSGGRVQCKLDSQNGRWVLTVANTNQNLGKEDLSHMFEPYWRKDASRTGTEHTGLGLAAAAAFAKLLDAQIKISLPRPDWLVVELGIVQPPARISHASP